MNYDLVIVGSGIYGSTIAALAKAEGKKPLVLEKNSHIGGLAYSQSRDGIEIHKYGCHIFHTNMLHVWNFMNQFCEFNNFIYEAIAFSKGGAYNLPINLNTMNQVFGTRTPEDAAKTLYHQTSKYKSIKDPQNLEEQALVLMGDTLYNLLVKEYTEKQWGRKCTELPPSIIKRLVIRNTYNNNYFNHPYQGVPYIGWKQVFENMLKGIEVKLNEKPTLDELKKFDCPIIFTGPIDELYDYQFGKLDYLKIRYEEKTFNTDNYQGVAVINHIDKTTPWTRSIEHNFFNPKYVSKTIISFEYFDEKADITAYPIRDKKNEELYNKYLTIIDKNIIPAGRLGLYRYLNMDDTVAAAMELWIEKFSAQGDYWKETEKFHL